MSANFFDLQFWQQLMTTFLGIGAVFLIDRYIERKHTKNECKQTLDALKTALDKNLGLLDEVARQLVTGTPSFSMDLPMLNYAVQKLYNHSDVSDILPLADHARYELTHFNEKLSMHKHVITRNPDEARTIILPTILAHISPLKTDLNAAINKIEIHIIKEKCICRKLIRIFTLQ